MKNTLSTVIVILLTAVFSMGEELPIDIQSLLNKRDQAVAKIDQTLVQELEKLKVKFTKAGDLESANKTVKLIEQYSANFELVGEWSVRSGTGWSGVFNFLPNGKINDGTWRIVNNKKVICKWPDGTSDTFDLPQVDGILTGVNSKGPVLKGTKIKK